MTTDKNKRLFQVTAEDFKKIPGSPIAYWATQRTINLMGNQKINLSAVTTIKTGMTTADNDRFLRLWHEVMISSTSLCVPLEEKIKWFPYNKGGGFRKWFGFCEYLVNWADNGYEIKNNFDDYGKKKASVRAEEFYFREAITYSAVTSAAFSARYSPPGAIFDSGGSSIFASHTVLMNVLAILASRLPNFFLPFYNDTINFQPGDVARIPILQNSQINSESCVKSAKKDWNSYETSWDFQHNPLIEANQRNQKPGKISGAYLQLRFEWQAQCEEMRRLEVENNRIFIEAYGLQEELSPDVPWNEITLTCNPWYRYGKTPSSVDSGQWIVDSEECHVGKVWGVAEQGTVHVSLPNGKIPASKMPFNQELETRLLTDTVKELLSYAVGCMFGRYSLDVDGLAYAGGEWDASKYKTFPADADNIIPICDDDYFEDDLTGRFVKFIETVYGTETLEENLNFIAHALGGRGSAREVIRNYFRNDFFEDHCKVYQKRPIYWLFDSGKKGGFRALIYMHRYQPDTIAKLRVDYVHEQQERYRTAIAELAPRADAASGSEKVKLAKRLTALRDQAEEVRLYEEKIHHLADRMVSIDLDDGVKHNYAIFQDVLARIK